MAHHEQAHDDHGLAHEMPVSMLISVFMALFILTLLTFDASYSISRPAYEGLPLLGAGHLSIFKPLFAISGLSEEVKHSLGVPIAMAIATVKALLVMLYFMHLRYDKALNGLVFFFCFCFFFLFIAFVLIDTLQYQGDISSYTAAQSAK